MTNPVVDNLGSMAKSSNRDSWNCQRSPCPTSLSLLLHGLHRALPPRHNVLSKSPGLMVRKRSCIEVQHCEAIGSKNMDRIFVPHAATQKSSVVCIGRDDERIAFSRFVSHWKHQMSPKAIAALIDDINPLCWIDMQVLQFRINIRPACVSRRSRDRREQRSMGLHCSR